MKNSNTGKQSIFRARPTLPSEQITLPSLQSHMKALLSSQNTDPSRLQQLEAISTLDQLIRKFSQLSIECHLSNIPLASPALHKQLLFYRQRISALEKKVKDSKNENLVLMRSLSNKEGEVCEKEQEIFELKDAIEEKEKAIIGLMKNLREKGQGEKAGKEGKEVKKEGKEQKKQEFKIVVNSPKIEREIKMEQKKALPSKPQWPQQRERLLRVLKQKDLKIYELILQLQSTQ